MALTVWQRSANIADPASTSSNWLNTSKIAQREDYQAVSDTNIDNVSATEENLDTEMTDTNVSDMLQTKLQISTTIGQQGIPNDHALPSSVSGGSTDPVAAVVVDRERREAWPPGMALGCGSAEQQDLNHDGREISQYGPMLSSISSEAGSSPRCLPAGDTVQLAD